MASLKQIHNEKGTGITSDAVEWVTITTYNLRMDATAQVESWVVGKDSKGRVASAKGIQSIERIDGTITLIGSMVDLLPFVKGSNSTLTTCSYRFNISGNNIQLQVKGSKLSTIEWIGRLDIRIN